MMKNCSYEVVIMKNSRYEVVIMNNSVVMRL